MILALSIIVVHDALTIRETEHNGQGQLSRSGKRATSDEIKNVIANGVPLPYQGI